MKFRVMTMMVAIVTASFGSAGAADGGHIGLYWDVEGTNCVADVAAFVQTNLYVYAKPAAGLPGGGGITGAELRIKGVNATMVVTVDANPLPGTIALGTPISDETQPAGSQGGANIAFADCVLPDANGNVLLYTLKVLILALTPDQVFEIDRKEPQSNPLLNPYALVNACDGPTFTAHEVSTGIAYMNHTNPGACGEVAVEEKTWGQIKNMYN